MQNNMKTGEEHSLLDFAVAVPVRHCSDLLRQRLGPRNSSVGLVVGCGNGNEVVYLHRALNSMRVIGIDIELKLSLLARNEVDIFVADGQRIPFSSGSFDFVAAFHSLEHMRDPAFCDCRNIPGTSTRRLVLRGSPEQDPTHRLLRRIRRFDTAKDSLESSRLSYASTWTF